MIQDNISSKRIKSFKNVNPIHLTEIDLIQVGKKSSVEVSFEGKKQTEKQCYLMGLMATILASEATFGDNLTILLDTEIFGIKKTLPITLQRNSEKNINAIQEILIKRVQENLQNIDLQLLESSNFKNIKINYISCIENENKKPLSILFSSKTKSFKILYDLGYFSNASITKFSNMFLKVILSIKNNDEWQNTFEVTNENSIELAGWCLNKDNLQKAVEKILDKGIVSLGKHLITVRKQKNETISKLLDFGFESVTTPYTSIDQIDQYLYECWSKILKTPKISFESNFFEEGGNSLKFIKLVNLVNEKFNKKWLITDFIKYPTYKEQYKLVISQNHQIKKQFGVQTLKPFNKEQSNIILVHDVSGNCDGYLSLIQKIKERFNVWLITAHYKNELGPYHCTINQIAQNYVNELPKDINNITLMGWSLGGRIVFEMANLINEGVKKILLFDTMDFGIHKSIEFTLDGEKKLLNAIGGVNTNKKTIQELWENDFNIDKEELSMPEWFENLFPQWEYMEIKEIIRKFNTYRSLSKAGADYKTEIKLNIPITYFLPERSENTGDTWLDKTNELIICKISGDHFSVFREENLNSILKELD